MNIDTLVAKLNSLSMADFSECEDESAGKKYYNHSDEEVGMLCCDLLIKEGHCNWSNIKKLKELGFDVYAGEKDSFGWLTGCVEYPDHERVVVYG